MSTLKISKVNLPSRLFEKDTNHIRRKVKEAGIKDTRFKDNSSAIRYYVRLGIAAETRTETANNLDDRIIKSSQKEVVTKTLLPVKNSIDELITAMQNFGRQQTEHFTEARKQNEFLATRIEALNELCSKQFAGIIYELMNSGSIIYESLRNTIILRSILYVFLFGYKTERFEPDDRIARQKVIAFAHQKAGELTDQELERIAGGELETKVVETLGKEIFAEIRKLQPQ